MSFAEFAHRVVKVRNSSRDFNSNKNKVSIHDEYAVPLSLSVLQTKTDTFANNVDSDETARYEPPHHCLPFGF